MPTSAPLPTPEALRAIGERARYSTEPGRVLQELCEALAAAAEAAAPAPVADTPAAA